MKNKNKNLQEKKNLECFRFLKQKIILDTFSESEKKFGIRGTVLAVGGIIPMLAKFFISCFPLENKRTAWEKLKNDIEVELNKEL